jgi:invasion protein IalB
MIDRLAEPTRRRSATVPIVLATALFLCIVVGGLTVGISTGMISLPAALRAASTADAVSLAPPTTPASTASAELVADKAVVSPAAVSAPAAAPPAGAQPKTTRQEDHGDWRLTCVQAPAASAPSCSIMQKLVDSKSGNPLFIWRIAQDGKGGFVGIWQTPEIVLLTRGLTLDAGTPKPIVVPFESCGNGACQVVANLTPDLLAALSKATALSASFVLNDGQQLKLPVSPKGLADAIAALSK